MEALLTYFLKSALYIMLFAGVYWFFLKNETFYRFNRFFLLAGLACALLLPLYTLTYEIQLIAVQAAAAEDGGGVAAAEYRGPYWTNTLLFVYAAGALFLLMRHGMGLYKIRKTALKYAPIRLNGCRIIETPRFGASFSVFNCIIIDNSAETSAVEKKLIMEHELAHVKQHHWADLLICQLFCAFQWFNPLAWIYLHLIKQNHEFLADEVVLKKGNSAAVYRATLINHSLGTPVFALASSFSRYGQLKRVKMMLKPASAATKKLVALLVLPALAFCLWAFAEPRFIMEEAIAQEQEVKQEKPGRGPKFVNEKPLLTEKKEPRSKTVKTRSGIRKQTAPAKQPEIKIVHPVSLPDSAEKKTDRPFMLNGVPAASQPLMLLDGIEISYSLANIKPEDIEAINVLKGTSALAAYGERGRNGVIQIISKKSGLRVKTGPVVAE